MELIYSAEKNHQAIVALGKLIDLMQGIITLVHYRQENAAKSLFTGMILILNSSLGGNIKIEGEGNADPRQLLMLASEILLDGIEAVDKVFGLGLKHDLAVYRHGLERMS